MIKENKIHFDSDVNNPYAEAINIVNNIKIHNGAISMLHNRDKNYYRNQYLTVLNERIINNKTLDKVGQILNVSGNRIYQLECKLKRILYKKMKGLYYDKRNTQII